MLWLKGFRFDQNNCSCVALWYLFPGIGLLPKMRPRARETSLSHTDAIEFEQPRVAGTHGVGAIAPTVFPDISAEGRVRSKIANHRKAFSHPHKTAS